MQTSNKLAKNLIGVLVAAVLLTVTTTGAQAQYTFGSEVQSTPSANITYSSGTFSYTNPDTDGGTDDTAYVPLTGSAASLITTTTNWSATLTVNLSAQTLTSNTPPSAHDPDNGLVLGLIGSNGSTHYTADVVLSQFNNSANTGSSNANYPGNTYGTNTFFNDQTNGTNQTTTALGSSLSYNGDSELLLTGGTYNGTSTESIAATSGVLTLNFNASTDTLTGSYNGTALGSYSLSNWGTNPTLTLGVEGYAGEGTVVTSGEDLGSSFAVTATPEPSTWALMLGGLGLLAFWHRRTRRTLV